MYLTILIKKFFALCDDHINNLHICTCIYIDKIQLIKSLLDAVAPGVFHFLWFLLNANWMLNIISQFSVIFLIIDVGHSFNFIGINKQMLYEYVGNVLVGSKPQDEGRPSPPTTGWIVRGKLTLQRQSELSMAAAVSRVYQVKN